MELSSAAEPRYPYPPSVPHHTWSPASPRSPPTRSTGARLHPLERGSLRLERGGAMLRHKKAIVVIGVVAVASGVGFAIYHFASAQQAPAFRFTTVERGDIQALVSATGTLHAVTTVSVGTQVSGQISSCSSTSTTTSRRASSSPESTQPSPSRPWPHPGEPREAAGAGNQATATRIATASSPRPGSSRQRARTGRSGTGGRRGPRNRPTWHSRVRSRTSRTPPSMRPSTESSSSAT